MLHDAAVEEFNLTEEVGGKEQPKLKSALATHKDHNLGADEGVRTGTASENMIGR